MFESLLLDSAMLREAILIGFLTLYTVTLSTANSAKWESERRDLFISRSEEQFQSQMNRLHRKPWSRDKITGRYPARFETDYKDREIMPEDLGRAIESRPDVQQKYRSNRKKRFFITSSQPRAIQLPEKGYNRAITTSPIIESVD
jgi:hypothetical protein